MPGPATAAAARCRPGRAGAAAGALVGVGCGGTSLLRRLSSAGRADRLLLWTSPCLPMNKAKLLLLLSSIVPVCVECCNCALVAQCGLRCCTPRSRCCFLEVQPGLRLVTMTHTAADTAAVAHAVLVQRRTRGVTARQVTSSVQRGAAPGCQVLGGCVGADRRRRRHPRPLLVLTQAASTLGPAAAAAAAAG
jgi:hypothetical protein